MKLSKNLKLRLIGGKAKKGFTIIELIVVVAIIGIVTGIIMASITNAKAKGRDSKRIADISVIQLALENYYDEYRHYPTALNDSNLINKGPIPQDPSTNLNYSYSALNAGNTATCSSNCQSYHLGATLELSNGVLEDDTIDMDSDIGFLGGGLVYDVFPKF